MWDFFGVVSLIFGIIIFLFMLIFTWVFAATFVISGIYAVFVYDYKSWTTLEKVSKKNSKKTIECFIDISKEMTRDISKSIV